MSQFVFLAMVLVLAAPRVFADEAASSSTVWVYRGDAGKSCEPKTAEPLESGTAELVGAHVPVLDSKKGSDGKMHMQVCGAPTGTRNRYLIPKDDLDRAEELGYRSENPIQNAPTKKAAKKSAKKKRRMGN